MERIDDHSEFSTSATFFIFEKESAFYTHFIKDIVSKMVSWLYQKIVCYSNRLFYTL